MSDNRHDASRSREVIPITRALISVYDKSGLLELAAALSEAGVQIVSTGSTARTMADAGYAVTDVSAVTGFPESLDGRVKTLHPAIHAGILADLRVPDHERQLKELGIQPFDLVVSNLYPFVETVASGAGADEVIEQIDIGGPAMVRAAAKNHANVAIVVSPASYPQVIKALTLGGTTLAQRQRLAAEAFAHTAAYDAAVAAWFVENVGIRAAHPKVAHPQPAQTFKLQATLKQTLRYGENSHQSAALYEVSNGTGIAQAEQLHGKEMSYNNYVDADAALRAAYDFAEPAVAVVKHANPCGIAIGSDIADAHRKAHACDPVSAYGGVIAASRTVTAAMAEAVKDIFTEVIIAPDFEPAALELLSTKKNLRILTLPHNYRRDRNEFRQISGGILTQTADTFAPFESLRDRFASWRLVAGAEADAATRADLEFAWRAVRAVKSNAILLAHGGASVGVGMGQVNRVDSCTLAITRAGGRAAGAVAASDAFFPFADGLHLLLNAGVVAVVQPGGSIRDEDVIAAAREAGVTMYFTGERHFYH
jgi:phosphoribosylaminoimidazolecarboxamide formyltransferase/IMP cyclohydrolase